MSKQFRVFNKERISLLEELENYQNEVGALRRAVDSKSAAITILQSELKECQNERDKFCLIAEHKPIGLSHLNIPEQLKSSICPETYHSAILSGSEGTLVQLLSQSKEESKQLRLELTNLRCRLHDALSDLKVIREEKSLHTDTNRSRISSTTSSKLANEEREMLLHQLEEYSSKCHALEGDIRDLLEEREELIKERDETKNKLHRLNHILNVLLSHNKYEESIDTKVIDLDAIITENRYLQSRLKQLKEEKYLAVDSAAKYKSVLEKSSNQKPSDGKIGSPENVLISPSQVSEFLKKFEQDVGEYDRRDLHSLLISLLDSLNQKSKVVKSQRAANKMLSGRVVELEKLLLPKNSKTNEERNVALISSTLMRNYVPPSGPHSIICEDLGEQEMLKLLQTNQETRKKNLNSRSIVVDAIQDADCKNASLIKNCLANSDNAKDNFSECDSFELTKNTSKSKIKQTSVLPKNFNVMSQETTQKSGTQCRETYCTESDLEEVIPVEDLDMYFMNLRKQRNSNQKVPNTTELENSIKDNLAKHNENCLDKSCHVNEKSRDGNESSENSFVLNLSDYESDDSNLQETLHNWQSEFEKKPCSPKRSKTSKLFNSKECSEEIPKELKDILQ